MQKKIKCDVVINGQVINYIWVLSDRKINTLSANVNDKYQIVVKTPTYISKNVVDDFVIKAYPNMFNRLQLKNNNQYFNLRNNFIKILGKRFDLVINVGNSKSTSKIFEDKIILNLKSIEDKDQTIKRLLTKKTKEIVIEMAIKKANLLNLQVNKWDVRDMKRAWAYTKHSKKEIYFSYKLVVFEYQIIDYVICHELAHLIYPNHSKDFWSLVSKLCPSYKLYKRVLKSFF